MLVESLYVYIVGIEYVTQQAVPNIPGLSVQIHILRFWSKWNSKTIFP